MNPKEATRLSLEGQSLPAVLTRRRARRAQAPDALAERARLVAGWETSPWPRLDASVWPIYRQPGFRRLVMPGVRRMLDEREAEKKRRHQEEMRLAEQKWRRAKALRKAAALPLFGDAA